MDTISAQVDKLASSTVVDPATIARSLGGLAGIVGSVAPGAGLDATFTSRINPAGAGAGGAPSLAGANPRTLRSIIGGEPGLAPDTDAEARLGDALANLAAAQARVDGKVKSLGGRIAASKTFGNGATEALKACGLTVSDAIITFRVADPPLPIVIRASATDAVTQEIRAAGGVKNYAGHLSRGSGVELVPPPAGASNFVVKVPKDAAKAGDLDVELTLEDSSGQVVKVPVKVQKP